MTSRSLGTLTLDLVAKIGGFTGGLDRASRHTEKRAKEIQIAAGKIGTAAGAAVVAAGATVVAWTKGVADMAVEVEKLSGLAGTSTQVFQQLAFGAKTVGIENEKLADIFKDVQDKVGDFMQTGGGAMADFFENIAPKVGVTADQFRKLSGPDALQLYVSTLEKAKVSQSEMTFYMEAIASDATALLPLLRNSGAAWQDLGTKASAYGAVLSTEVIEQSKELQRQTKMLEGMFQGLKNEVGAATIPVLTALGKSFQDVVNETNLLDGAVGGLKKSDAVRVFAEDAGRELAKLADYIAQSKREFHALVDFAESTFRATKAYATFDFEGGRKIAKEFQERYGLDDFGRRVIQDSGTEAGKTFTQAYDAQLAAAARSRFALNDPRRLGPVGSISQQLALAGVGTGKPPRKAGGRGANTNDAAQQAAAELAAELAEITRARDAFLNTYSNIEQLLQTMRSAGLVDERDYFKQKGILLDNQTAAEVQALQKTIDRLQQEKLVGKDATRNLDDIKKAQAELAKVRENSATATKILSIEEQAAFKRVENSILSAKQAAQSYLSTLSQGLNMELQGMGLGSKARERSGRASGIGEQYERQRQDLLNQRRQTELLAGPLGPDAERAYQEQLKIINEGNAAALASLTDFYTKVDVLQSNWRTGATEALTNYFDETQDIAKQTEDIVGKAFKGMEDALTDFASTGKLDFKGLVDSILADITRMTIRSQITGPLSQFVNGAVSGSGGSGGGGWLSGLLSIFGGARANGGPVEAGKLYRVNEQGPELYNVNGAQFLLPSANGTITPNRALRGGGGDLVVNFAVQGRIDQATQTQMANKMRREQFRSTRMS